MVSPETLHGLLASYGLWAVAVVIGLESMGLPLPGETMLLLAAGYAGSHDGNIVAIIVAASIGAIVGDNIGFLLGSTLGTRFLRRFGSAVGLTDDRIRLGQYLFKRHGGKVVFFGRFVALLRFLAAFLAGANRMDWTRFFFANAAGGILWATLVGMIGFLFGRELSRIEGPIGAVGLLALAGILAWGLIYLKRNEAKLQAEADKAKLA